MGTEKILGRLAVIVLASVLPAFLHDQHSDIPPTQSTEDGRQLLHKLQNALGGAARIAAVRDYEEAIRAEAWDSSGASLGAVRKRTRWMRSPNVVRLDQIGPRGTYVLFFDGGVGEGWEILPDVTHPDPYRTTGKAVPLAGGELRFARGYLSGFELNLWLADRMPGYAVAAPKPSVLRIQHGDATTDLTLDPATSLPMKSAGVSLADPDRPVAAEMHCEEWREIEGVRFPTHRVNYQSGVKRGEVTTSAIRINAGLRRETLTATPADFAPDIPKSRPGE